MVSQVFVGGYRRTSTSLLADAADAASGHANIFTDALSKVVVWRWVISCPNHNLMCWYRKFARWSSERHFAVLWLSCKREDGAWSLQEFFLWWDILCWPCRDRDESLSRQFVSASHWVHSPCTKPSNRRAPEFKIPSPGLQPNGPWNYWGSWKAALLLLLASVWHLKSIYHRRDARWS